MLFREAEKADIVLDCSDNFATRYRINSACVTTKTALMSATVSGFSGQISLFAAHDGTPCYQCLYPDSASCSQSCADSGVIAPAAGMIGTLQALETIKFLAGIETTLKGKLLTFNALKTDYRCFTLKKDTTCSVCKTR